ncbi:MAG: arylsulfatase [Burkholderiales bacterium]|nr:arylsulfatase [Burkholderiales bacterium]
MRIALVHALAHSVAPINAAFATQWPDAVLVNLLDDSLSADLARNRGVLDAAMHARFTALTDYAVNTGADAVLFTCSAFGPCIEGAAARHPAIPVLKPNEAMIADAVDAARAAGGDGARIGLIASFAPTLQSMPPEFPGGTPLDCELVEDAMAALNRGEPAVHDAAVAAAAQRLQTRGAAVIALAQFSMARAASVVASATGLPVFTTPDSAIRLLKERLAR